MSSAKRQLFCFLPQCVKHVLFPVPLATNGSSRQWHILDHMLFSEIICKKSWNFSGLLRVNPLHPSDAIWGCIAGSTLAQVMACCRMAPNHYLNQCWLIISEDLWHSLEDNSIGNAQEIYPWYEFENWILKITATSPRGQWVKLWPSDEHMSRLHARSDPRYQFPYLLNGTSSIDDIDTIPIREPNMWH